MTLGQRYTRQGWATVVLVALGGLAAMAGWIHFLPYLFGCLLGTTIWPYIFWRISGSPRGVDNDND